MRYLNGVKRLLFAAGAVGLASALSGCVAYPAYPGYAYGYGPGAYAPGYYQPAPVVVGGGWGWGRGRGWHQGWRGGW